MGLRQGLSCVGADIPVTYLNEKARSMSIRWPSSWRSPIFMPLDVMVERRDERVMERIEKEWGQLDFLLHSIAFSPKGTLHGRVVDVDRNGFSENHGRVLLVVHADGAFGRAVDEERR